MEQEQVRVDKWLWAVRIFKTRQRAQTACNRGHVTIAGQRVKPSRLVSVGDKIRLRKEGLTLEYEVLACIAKRVGAKEAARHRKDLTPESVIEQHKLISRIRTPRRPKGMGRPTKKDRRTLDRFFEGY